MPTSMHVPLPCIGTFQFSAELPFATAPSHESLLSAHSCLCRQPRHAQYKLSRAPTRRMAVLINVTCTTSHPCGRHGGGPAGLMRWCLWHHEDVSCKSACGRLDALPQSPCTRIAVVSSLAWALEVGMCKKQKRAGQHNCDCHCSILTQ